MLQRNMSLFDSHVWCHTIQMISENKLQLLSSLFLFIFFFCQKQPHYLLMTLIPGKGVKTTNVLLEPCWNSINSRSGAGPGDRCCITALPLWGERSVKCPPLLWALTQTNPQHTTCRLSLNMDLSAVFFFFFLFLCITHLNNIFRKW